MTSNDEKKEIIFEQVNKILREVIFEVKNQNLLMPIGKMCFYRFIHLCSYLLIAENYASESDPFEDFTEIQAEFKSFINKIQYDTDSYFDKIKIMKKKKEDETD